MTQNDEWKIEKPMTAYMAGYNEGVRWRLADVKPRPPPCPTHPANGFDCQQRLARSCQYESDADLAVLRRPLGKRAQCPNGSPENPLSRQCALSINVAGPILLAPRPIDSAGMDLFAGVVIPIGGLGPPQ